MFRWVTSPDEQRQRADGPDCIVRIAAEQGPGPVEIEIELASDSEVTPEKAPAIEVKTPSVGCEASGPARSGNNFRYRVTVHPAADPSCEDQVVIDLQGKSDPEVPPCRIVLRRSICRISTALLEREGLEGHLPPTTRAALLWYSWGRYSEVVGLKRFGTGLSGSDVLVFRPRLKEVDAARPTLDTSGPCEVVAGAWGSPLLVKTGKYQKIRREWDRFQIFLANSLHPFLARCEAYLPIRPGSESGGSLGDATLISSFLGGRVLQVEPLELAVRGTSDTHRLQQTVSRTFEVSAEWYAASKNRPLGDWPRVFRWRDDGQLLLFGKFDFARPEDRNRYCEEWHCRLQPW